MYRTRKSGFTLVEILIVVIILGILAAIVIPQFTNASQDARKNSLTSQLQTVRSQLELAKLQHRDTPSPALLTGAAGAQWVELTGKTDDSYVAGGNFGPYLNGAPVNPLNGKSDVKVLTSGTEPAFGDTVAATDCGWVYFTPTNKIFATTKQCDQVYNEGTGANSDD